VSEILAPSLFTRVPGIQVASLAEVADLLDAQHYLGAASREFALVDEVGILVFANPSSRRLPQHRWLELVRWCILNREKNSGSQQWSAAHRWLRKQRPDVTTVVSYSDPSVGHTGALYRASNWLWAPTWHRLRPPPSGNGSWTVGKRESVKDRWVYALRDDAERAALLAVKDDAILRRLASPAQTDADEATGR
jgi:hypothetical protein